MCTINRASRNRRMDMIRSILKRNESRSFFNVDQINLVHEYWRPLIVVRKYRLTGQSSIALENEMKRLNEEKQFEKGPTSFDTYREKHATVLPSSVSTQALKASTQLDDLERGIAIDLLQTNETT